MGDNEVLEAQREATATIRGYIYQFDVSIRKVISAAANEYVIVEGVEDFDIHSPDVETYGQVKYYEAQKLTDSTLRDAILPMLQGFLRSPADRRARKKYVLYGHFKEASELPPTTKLADLKRILVQRVYADNGTGGKVRTEVNLQEKLGATDEELADFGARLDIQIGLPFSGHRALVVDELRAALSVSKIEAESYIYPSAQSVMSTLCCGRDRAARKITRQEFLQRVRPNRAVYSAWALREESESSYCKEIRRRHFSDLNVDSRDRFFVVRLPVSDTLDDIHGLVQHVVARWSSHKVNMKPNKERYAPIFFFPDLDNVSLVDLKMRLSAGGHIISDGYAFLGAKFSADQLMRPQTRDWPVSARFVSGMDQFTTALSASQKQKIVIQLYAEAPQDIDSSVLQIAVLVKNANMACKIV